MDKFEEQLNRNLENNIIQFNSSPEYATIRELYKRHFDTIKAYIQKFGHKPAIEDISYIDSNLTQIISDNSLMLKEINKAISTQKLTLNDIK